MLKSQLHVTVQTVSRKSLELRTSKTAESVSGEREITWKGNLLPAQLWSTLLIWHQIHPKQQRPFQGRAMRAREECTTGDWQHEQMPVSMVLLLLTQHQELLHSHLIEKPLVFVELQLPRDKRCP